MNINNVERDGLPRRNQESEPNNIRIKNVLIMPSKTANAALNKTNGH